jgi:hypothetical protein
MLAGAVARATLAAQMLAVMAVGVLEPLEGIHRETALQIMAAVVVV